MTRAFFIVAMSLAFCSAASAQTPATKPANPAAQVRLVPGIASQPAPTPSPEPTTSVPFGCDARTGNVCYFRIFYQRGDRVVILPAGMKNKVPGVTIGRNYCMTLGKAPVNKCTPRKVINATYNS